MDYKYISSDAWYKLIQSTPKNVSNGIDFWMWMEELGIKYYIYSAVNDKNPKRLAYIYCGKRYSMTRIKYDL